MLPSPVLTCSKRVLFVRHAMTYHTPCKNLGRPVKMKPSLVLYLTTEVPIQCSTNWTIKTSGSWLLWVRNTFSGHFATRLRGFAAQFLSPSFLCQQAALLTSFGVIGLIICSGLHFLSHWFNIWWITRVGLTNQKRGKYNLMTWAPVWTNNKSKYMKDYTHSLGSNPRPEFFQAFISQLIKLCV